MKAIVVIFLLTSSICFTKAQTAPVQGIVTIFDSIPLVGVQIEATKAKVLVQTDSTGRFTINRGPTDVLKLTAKGFYKQRVKLQENTKVVAVNMKLKPVSGDKTYEIGYGHIAEKDKLYAVAMMNKSDTDFSRYNTVYDILKVHFTGVTVVNGNIQVRGQKSFNASASALIVLDGVIVDASVLSSIPTAQIKSINVIKDGGASIYGVRGANGVVIIETDG